MQNIALSSWSLNTFFKNGSMDWRSFCAAVRGFGLHHVELNNHFFTSQDEAYIDDLAQTLKDYDISVVNLAIDEGGDLASEDNNLRQQAIASTKKWIDRAAKLSAYGVRNNTGGSQELINDEEITRCADSFRELCDYAAQKNMKMIIENHGGMSSNIDALDLLFQQIDRGNLTQALDFGNWPEERRYESVERSVHRAGLIHPKTHAFDDRGEQTEWDTYRMAHEVMRSGFEGAWVIEYESEEQDRFTGIQLSIDMIRRCFAV